MRIGDKHYRTVWFEDGLLKLINQPLLPHRLEIFETMDYKEAGRAIQRMVVRGAPAIGATGAFAMVLAIQQGEDPQLAADFLRESRPTAQDLFYGIQRVLDHSGSLVEALKEANAVAEEYIHACETIGRLGASLIGPKAKISTHCNAGWLATVDWGTALAPIYWAHRQGKQPFVWVDETRPRCQGGRLTAFELKEEGIDHAVIADNAMGYFTSRGEVDIVIVGSDRIARNGDIANKIGTYSSALAAKAAGIPFYVAAPLATVDRECASGKDIPIEERSGVEVSAMFGWCQRTGQIEEVQITPSESPVRNPAFDVTPAKWISGIITEKGIVKPEDIGELL